MTNIIEFNSTSSCSNTNCWLCQKGVSMRALFCHHCGTIQPVRDIDHFARLGLERRIDIDMELLERQYEAFKRTLDPGRFSIRGVGERGHAAKQMEALDMAYDTLRDPLCRGRYWLALHQKDFAEPQTQNEMLKDLRTQLNDAADPSQCDRVAQRAGQAMEEGLLGLMQSLRGQNWEQANDTLVELDGLESILDNVRHRRAQLSPDVRSGEALSSVK